MSYTEPSFCSICDAPTSLCQCAENTSKVLGVRLGNVIQAELAKTLRKVPPEDRVLFFCGFMATCSGHMKAAIGVPATQVVIDALKVMADSDPRAATSTAIPSK